MGMGIGAPGRGLQSGETGQGSCLNFPTNSVALPFLSPGLPVGSVCHSRPGAAAALHLCPRCGDGQPAGVGPGPSHIPADGVAGFGVFGKPGLLEAGQPRGTARSRCRCPVQARAGPGAAEPRGSVCQKQINEPGLPCHERAVSQRFLPSLL